jgi:type III restriction enzyme
MIGDGDSKRRFSYELDIESRLEFESYSQTSDQINQIATSLSKENRDRSAFAITLDESSKTAIREESLSISENIQINIEYMTRRYTEIIENPFLARKCAQRHLDAVMKKIGENKLKDHFGFIVSLLSNLLLEEKSRQEENIFMDYLSRRSLVLAVSDDESIGYRIPQLDEIDVGRIPSAYKYYLFEDVDITAINRLEQKVGDILDSQQHILWWFRNKGKNPWYSIQGWQEYKIRPDFVAAKKTETGKLELVYILESKGEHLLGNTDTEYKKKVLDLMTEQHKNGKIAVYEQMELPLHAVNEKAEFYLIEENKEEQTLRTLLK